MCLGNQGVTSSNVGCATLVKWKFNEVFQLHVPRLIAHSNPRMETDSSKGDILDNG